MQVQKRNAEKKMRLLPLSALLGMACAQVCPVATCVVDTTHTSFPWLNLRPTPCNNKPALRVLHDGDAVYSLEKTRHGCSFDYTQVFVVDQKPRKLTIGWVNARAIRCTPAPDVPVPALL